MMKRTIKVGEHKLPFIMYEPAKTTRHLVVCLHGLGEVGPSDGSQITEVERYGYPMHAKNGFDFPFAIIAPQVSGWNHLDIVSLINTVSTRYGFNNVFVTGLSGGGEITWKMLDKSSVLGPTLAGIAPVAGKWTSGISIASTLKDIPVFVHHNAGDTVMPWAKERGGEQLLVEALNNVASRLHVIVYKWIYPGTSHDAWTKAYTPGGDLAVYLSETMVDTTPEEPVKDPVVETYRLGDYLVFKTESGVEISMHFIP